MHKNNNHLNNQTQEKEKRAAELVIANKELAFQNEEKEKRAAELIIANKELIFQNEEKEKRAAEFVLAKEYESKLTALNVKLSAINDTIYDTLYTLDINGIIQSVNKAAVKNLGYTEEEMVGASAHDLFHYEYKNSNKLLNDECEIQIANRELKSYFGEQKFIKKDGTLIDVEVASNPLIIDNKMIGSVAVCRDIKIQKEALKLLEDAKSLAEESNRLKSDFLTNMSHEIRTPMNAVMGLSKLLLDTKLVDSQKNYAENIYKSSNALLRILNEILDFSKIEANRLEIENYSFKTKDLLGEINTLFSNAAAQKDLELVLDIEPNVPDIISGDKMRLSQIIGNLVGNAIKFTQKGEIHIRVDTYIDKGKTFLEFFVRDTGIGISPDQMKKLFEPFIQADSSTTRKYGGTGLGLVISKKLIELMGGVVNVISVFGEGSTFSFKIPLFETREVHLLKQYTNKIKGMKTLLVDDLHSSVVVLEKMLTSLQFNVTATTLPNDAYELFVKAEEANEPFELLILDWKMPELDGLQLAQKINAYCKDLNKIQIIIMLTAFDRDQFLAQEKSELAHAVLNKPTTSSTLFNTIIDIQYGRYSHDFKVNTHTNNYLTFAKSLKNKKVLLVEDNETNRIVASGFLKKMGLKVSVAEDGFMALQKVVEEDFDVILMDIQMPNMNGLEATKKLRENGFKKPIIAMTAAAMQSDKENAKSAGMDEYVTKPIDDEELAITLLKHLDKSVYLSIQKNLSHNLKEKKVEDVEFTFDVLKKHLFDDEDLMQKSLSAFYYDLENIEDGLKKAIVKNDIEDFKALLHKLKGAAGNLKAIKLQKLAQEYEINLKNENYSSMDDLQKELSLVKNSTSKFLSKLQNLHKKDYKLETTGLEEIIKTISQNLKKQRLVDDEMFQTLLQKGIDSSLHEKLSQQINAFDYAKAKETLKQIANKYGVNYE